MVDHCVRPGFLTFELPAGAKLRQPAAAEILSFRNVRDGGKGGPIFLLPIAKLSWALTADVPMVKIYQTSPKGQVRILEEEICPAVMAEFAQVPSFVEAFNDRATYQEIVRIFPAVGKVPKLDDENHSDNSVAALLRRTS